MKRPLVLSLLFLSFNGLFSEAEVKNLDTVKIEFYNNNFSFCSSDELLPNTKDKDLQDIEIVFFDDDKFLDNELIFIFDESEGIFKNKKKKKEKAAAIFWGLANAVSSIAQAANGNPREGVANFVGTVFNTAAQIAQIEANYTKEAKESQDLRSYLIFNPMTNMVEALYSIMESDVSRDDNLSRFPNLKELSLLSEYAQRISWIANKILNNSFVQVFLEEVLDYLEVYLHDQVDELIVCLREKLLIKNSNKNEKIVENVS
ncbi:hypothetical protein GF385_04440 [Candidatus Dependentiae bacterium]|nr:hypothetical protein [Candidatus Dependentiae bacterium]